METLEQFKSTDLYQRMLNHFDYVVEDMATEDGQFFDETRRQGLVSWTSLDIFYRIWLVEQGCKQGTKILDFGAGPNLLSKWFDIYAVDKDVWKEMVDLGWSGILIPEEFGGSGLGLIEATAILEEVSFNGCNAGACHPHSWFSSFHRFGCGFSCELLWIRWVVSDHRRR